jgi:putative aldouronate transport system substrate-binding protein
MKNLSKKVNLILVLLFLLMVVLTGCVKNTAANTSSTVATESDEKTQGTAEITPYQDEMNKGEVMLKYYLLGDPEPHQKMVWDEINKLMKKDINATIDVQNISWSDWTTKYPLIFNSGEDFDIIFTCDWCYYNDMARSGGFLELTDDMVKNYCPNTAPLLFGEFSEPYKLTFINGKSFHLCQCFNNADGLYSGIIRGDLREKYNLPEVKSFDDLVNYIKVVCVKEKMPFVDANNRWIGAWASSKNFDWSGTLLNGITFDKNKNDGKIFNVYETPEYLEFAKLCKELQDIGAISKSALANKIEAKDHFKNGTTPVVIQRLGGALGYYNECMEIHPEFKLEFIDYQGDNKIGRLSATGGYAIHATSKYPERSLMAADLLHSKKEYYTLLEYGIAGVHYEPIGDKMFKQLDEGSKNYPAQAVCPWMLMDERFDLLSDKTPESYINLSKKYASRVESLITDGFIFDDSNVANEVAAVGNIVDAYYFAIPCGLAGDPEEAVRTLVAKLKEVGIDMIIQEVQNEMDKFIASKN